MSSGYDEETIKIIKSVFPKIVIEDNFIKIFEQNTNIINSFLELFINNKNKAKKECFQFEIKDDHIYIHWLSKCGIIKGPEFLDKILILATKLNKKKKRIKCIKLVDASTKTICNNIVDINTICLRTIKILSTGESWYNNHGYYSKNYEKEKKLNKEIIEKKYIDFLNILNDKFENLLFKKYNQQYEPLITSIQMLEKSIDKIKNSSENPENLTNNDLRIYEGLLKDKQHEKKQILHKYNIDKQIDIHLLFLIKFNKENVIRLFYNLNIDIENITVKDFFKSIWDYIIQNSKNCKDANFINQIKMLAIFVYLINISNILTYDKHLEKQIETEDDKIYSATKYLKYKNKYLKYKNKYLNLKNQLG